MTAEVENNPGGPRFEEGFGRQCESRKAVPSKYLTTRPGVEGVALTSVSTAEGMEY